MSMPCYQAIIIGSEQKTPCVFEFVAASDEQAIARMPQIDRNFTLEIWCGDRLIGNIEEQAVTVANCDLAAVTAKLLGEISSGN